MAFMEHLIDREMKLKHWGEGEWLDEPDRFQFIHKNLNCEMLRIHATDGLNGEYLFGGHWCGYVKLPRKDFMTEEEINNLDVHGGITFNGFRMDSHWIGFDCAHLNDITPSKQSIMASIAEKYNHLGMLWASYKNFDYVLDEVKSLAEQVSKKVNELPISTDLRND